MAVRLDYPDKNIKQVPQDLWIRERIRMTARRIAGTLQSRVSPDMDNLTGLAKSILIDLDLQDHYLGFTIVSISNAYWQERFEAVEYNKRLLLLPQCLSDKDLCTGTLDSVGLHCALCGACDISDLKTEAEALGYQVVAAEGTSAVLNTLLEGQAEAVLGVACLDSLEKSYARVSQIGIPHLAVPLLDDGCVNTTAEIPELLALLRAQRGHAPVKYRSYLPLLRYTYRLFEDDYLPKILESGGIQQAQDPDDPVLSTQQIALDWLRTGGKRLRPFITVAAYAVGKYGEDVAVPGSDPRDLIPPHVQALASAIEALHKASLVHDDIEDQEKYRYGRMTVQAQHGVGPAINVGDYLIGLGFNLIASQAEALGADVAVKILGLLSGAQLELCRGQGAEIMWKSKRGECLSALDALSIYALKTAPAFEVSLAAGLLAAGANVEPELLRRFCTYLGQAYQIDNDLDDWTEDSTNHVMAGGDMLAGRPTLLWAFLCETGEAENFRRQLSNLDPTEAILASYRMLESLGVLRKAALLKDKLRAKALETAQQCPDPNLASLLQFLTRVIVPS